MWDGPYGEWGSRKYMLASLDQSLGRLGLDYVDVFYSHRPDPDTPIEETMGALATAVRQGKALYAGISNYSPDQTLAAAAALRAEGVPLSIHQPRYSMFDRHIEDGLFPALDEVGAAAIVFSPLAQGLLTDRYLDGEVPAGSRAATSHFLTADRISAEYLERARALDAIARERGQTLAQLALVMGAASTARRERTHRRVERRPARAERRRARRRPAHRRGARPIEPLAAHGTALG